LSLQENKSVKITVRKAETIYHSSGRIQDGTFRGRWHFSFDMYEDSKHEHFGNLRVLNDDTLSPGAVWPLHPHSQNEVVTYVAEGEFRHEDERGKGGVLLKGGVQHTTVGRGMYHSEINNRKDLPMRFIQIWYYPEKLNLTPSVEQREVERKERTDRWLPLVSYDGSVEKTLPLRADGAVYSSYLRANSEIDHDVKSGHGLYLYVLEGGPVRIDRQKLAAFDAAEILGDGRIPIKADGDSELLLFQVNLAKGWPRQ
jgi:quercetin 2,3-dioxygenase